MGNKLLLISIILFIFLIFIACSPKIAEIQGKDITYDRFIHLLQKEDSRFYRRKSLIIESQVSDWKRLESILTDYLNSKAILLELRQSGFSKTISPNIKKLFYLYSLARFTFEKLKKGNKLGRFKRDTDRVILYEDVLNKANNDSLVVLEVKNELTLTVEDIKTLFPRQNNIKYFIRDNIVDKIYLSIEGKRLRFDKIPFFKGVWKVDWEQRLIYLYKKKLINILTQKVAKRGEKLLKDYYKANKSKFGMYPKSTGVRQWYQLSYSRARESIIEHFVEKDFNKLQKGLWKKYKISISNKYFKSFKGNV